MTALKGRDIEAFLAKPSINQGLILVYGPDSGLVGENAGRLVKAFTGDPPDPESLTTLHMSEIDADVQRLGIEARSASLFGSHKTIRVRGGTNKLSATLTELLDQQTDAMFIVEAGDLKPSDSLRKIAEQRRDSRALPCYADTGQAIEKLIRESLSQANIAFEPDLVGFLRDLLGNDRQVTRGEIEKLILYAGEGGQLSREDVTALCGDNAALALDMVVDAIASGHAKNFDTALIRAAAAGTDTQRILMVALNHFARLRAMRAQVDEGTPPDQVIARATPRIHFSRKSAIEQQLRLWNDESLANACARLTRAIAQSRKAPALAQATARQAMLAVCMAAARR